MEAAQHSQEAQAPAVEAMNDQELESAIESIASGEDGNQGDSPAYQPSEDRKEADQQAQPGNTPVTLDTLREEVKAVREQLERERQNAKVREQTLGRQGQELGELRKLREKLLARKEELANTNPAETFVRDPNAFRAEIQESIRVENTLQQVDQAEKAAMQREQQAQNYTYLREKAPDLPDNLKTIADILRESGDSEETVRAFTVNPLQFPPQTVLMLNQMAQQRLRMKAMEEEARTLREKPQTLLQQIQDTARKPMTNAAGGSAKGGGSKSLPELSDSDISKLSDKELDALIKETSK